MFCRWIDIRPSNENHALLLQLMEARIATAKTNGCQGLEYDNVDCVCIFFFVVAVIVVVVVVVVTCSLYIMWTFLYSAYKMTHNNSWGGFIVAQQLHQRCIRGFFDDVCLPIRV